MKKITLIGIAVMILILGVIVFFGFRGDKCVGEFENMAVGVAPQYQKECCEGLVPEAPQGFVGGAWCVLPKFYVVCEIHNNIEGIYAREKVEGGGEAILLKQIDCK